MTGAARCLRLPICRLIRISCPRLYTYWENQGLQVDTTSKLFDKFISSGAGMPVIVAYESSFIDWYEAQSDSMKAQAARIVGLYPEITSTRTTRWHHWRPPATRWWMHSPAMPSFRSLAG